MFSNKNKENPLMSIGPEFSISSIPSYGTAYASLNRPKNTIIPPHKGQAR